jgi:hypothetical protein
MHAAPSIAQLSTREEIDHTRRFIAEEFTPLFHTSIYAQLPAEACLRYNQLHAFYFNEQVSFFEQEMLSPALLALQSLSLPPRLADGLQTFFDEEQRHTAMFRALNRRAAPELYTARNYHFIHAPWAALFGLKEIARQPDWFPFVFWLALLQEERSLHYSRGCLARRDELEPTFVATHRSHLADEVGHVAWDEEVLDWLWPQIGRWRRKLNARLFSWMLGEFFFLPRRSGLRVVTQLQHEFPQLETDALEDAMRELEGDFEYQRMLYSREITPRTFARFDAEPEFALLARTLPGYRPARFTP